MPYIDSFNVGNVAYDMRDKYAGLYTADAYSNSAIYSIGNMVTYDGKLYKCNTDIPTPEAWTPAHWTETTMAAETSTFMTEIEAQFEQKTIENAAMASFDDGADNVPIKSLIIDIAAIQNGTGEASPTNIRNIIGWADANISKSGKNLLNLSSLFNNSVAYLVNANGSVSVLASDTAAWTAKGSMILKPGTYILSRSNTAGTLDFYLTTFDNVAIDLKRMTEGTASISFTVANPCLARCKIYNINNFPQTVNLQLEKGSTATAFEAPTFTTYLIDFPDGAGTVYGGKLEWDADNGWVLTVTHAYVELDTLTWIAGENSNFGSSGIGNLIIKTGYSNAIAAPMICSKYPTTRYYSAGTYYEGKTQAIAYAFSANSLQIKDTDYTDLDTFTASLSGVQLVYQLATPVVYNLTDEQVITTLLATNNIWANCGNITELVYRTMNNTDTKITLVKAIIAPVLDEMKADTALVANDFRIVGNTLYRITGNVASGATLTPGTNCTATTIAAILKSLL